MGLTLEQLGFEPRLEDLTQDQQSRLDADDLEWAGSITPARRDRSLFQAKLLAGALWEASAVLIDQIFEDLDGLRDLDRVDRHDIANTFVLSGLPPRHADKYCPSGWPPHGQQQARTCHSRGRKNLPRGAKYSPRGLTNAATCWPPDRRNGHRNSDQSLPAPTLPSSGATPRQASKCSVPATTFPKRRPHQCQYGSETKRSASSSTIRQ